MNSTAIAPKRISHVREHQNDQARAFLSPDDAMLMMIVEMEVMKRIVLVCALKQEVSSVTSALAWTSANSAMAFPTVKTARMRETVPQRAQLQQPQ